MKSRPFVFYKNDKEMSTINTLNSNEITQLFDAVINKKFPYRDRAMLTLSIYAGMRVSEIATLKMGDVLDSDGKLKHALTPRKRKNSRNPRIVYLTQKVMNMLDEYLATIQDKSAGKHVFHADKSESFTVNGLTQWFFTRYKEVGIRASSGSGHKSFCQQLASKGVSIKTICELAGHRHTSTTKRYLSGLYSKSTLLRCAVELVE